MYRYDFTDVENKKMIEFHGDRFHGNPVTYKKTDTPNPFNKKITCEILWERDRIKQKLSESQGFEYLVVWESEYRKNKTEIVEKCVKFLKQ